jgi:dTDP-4-dehydrorhamnose reductase
MTWLVTGAGGMLGAELTDRLRARGAEVVALRRGELDLCDEEAVRKTIDANRPSVVVNCAAWTAVDDAETHETEALAVNGTAVENLGRACRASGARLIQISTDYVFDGTATEPYPEDAPVSPVNAYGRTKLAGERTALAAGGYVVRTAWLYGAHGPNFVRTMIRLAAERETVDVVDDQLGQPTWTADLAGQIIRLGGSALPAGIYHGTSSGSTTWYGLTREIFTLLGHDPARVRPTTTAAFPRPAARPAFSVLAHTRQGLPPLRDWREALRAAWPALIAV